MRTALIACTIAAALAACAPPAERQTSAPAPEPPPPIAAPAGEYRLDPSHADLSFRVDHIGMSMYTARFTRFEARLQFDPAHPEAMRVEARIDPRSLVLPAPPAGFLETMLGPQWFDAARFPEMTFRSTRVEPTGARSARVYGELTLHGVTAPVTFEATYNGGYAGHPMDPNARIGFSAQGALSRSAFGMGYGVPPPGSTMGVGDDVRFAIETEFNGPPWAGAPAAAEQR